MNINCKDYSGKCSCGRTHDLSTEKIFINQGALKNLENFLIENNLSDYTAAVYDTNTYSAKGITRIKVKQEIILDAENLHANETAVDKVLKQLEPNIKYILAIGAGTIHDIVRYSANFNNINFISCPTAASVDGFCSTVSAMTWKGYKKTMPGIAPIYVYADLDVISKAPIDLALSGIGDMIGKFTSLADWKISHAVTGEHYCDRISNMTLDSTLKIKEISGNINDDNNSETYKELIYGLLISGLAMQMMGNSRPASGSEHHISHLIEMEPKNLGLKNNASHGEKVGVATILISELYHDLALISADDISKYIKDYTPLKEKDLRPIFGELTESILEENKEDELKKVTKESLTKNWHKVQKIVLEIPDKGTLIEFFNSINAKSSLSDIGVEPKNLKILLDLSPLVRNRLTFNKIRRLIDYTV
ncbi:MAG: sn-glycerol-1-phosphate dehydrogenase [Clostridium sp.]|nr:sn-glycerol-1-phosphate dehydrogenase [Clostridium sp.]